MRLTRAQRRMLERLDEHEPRYPELGIVYRRGGQTVTMNLHGPTLGALERRGWARRDEEFPWKFLRTPKGTAALEEGSAMGERDAWQRLRAAGSPDGAALLDVARELEASGPDAAPEPDAAGVEALAEVYHKGHDAYIRLTLDTPGCNPDSWDVDEMQRQEHAAHVAGLEAVARAAIAAIGARPRPWQQMSDAERGIVACEECGLGIGAEHADTDDPEHYTCPECSLDAALQRVQALLDAATQVLTDTVWEDGPEESGAWPSWAASCVHPRALAALRKALRALGVGVTEPSGAAKTSAVSSTDVELLLYAARAVVLTREQIDALAEAVRAFDVGDVR